MVVYDGKRFEIRISKKSRQDIYNGGRRFDKFSNHHFSDSSEYNIVVIYIGRLTCKYLRIIPNLTYTPAQLTWNLMRSYKILKN